MAALSDALEDFCFFDFETRNKTADSVVTLGTYAYAKRAKPIVLTWAIGDAPVGCVADSEGVYVLPDELKDFHHRARRGEAWFVAWKTSFDRAIWNSHESFHASDQGDFTIDPEMAIDAMCQAMAANLPPDLEGASAAIDGPPKLKGSKLIDLFSRHDGGTMWTHPAEWELFKDYAIRDVESLREVYKATRPLPVREWRHYWASERINERGIAVDVEFCKRAHELAVMSKEWTNRRLAEITGEPQMRVTMVQQLAAWVYDRVDLIARSYMEEPLPDPEEQEEDQPKQRGKLSLDRSTVRRIIAYIDSIPEAKRWAEAKAVQQALTLREYGGSSSPMKFQKMVRQADGGRLKDQYVFNGGQQTGRFSSRGVQIHNLPRESLGRQEQAAIEDIFDMFPEVYR